MRILLAAIAVLMVVWSAGARAVDDTPTQSPYWLGKGKTPRVGGQAAALPVAPAGLNVSGAAASKRARKAAPVAVSRARAAGADGKGAGDTAAALLDASAHAPAEAPANALSLVGKAN